MAIFIQKIDAEKVVKKLPDGNTGIKLDSTKTREANK